MTRTLKVVSLFSGLGGIDYGFEAAGFETCAAVELDADCCETMRQNRPWPVICDDIRNVKGSRILETAGLKSGEVDVLLGGPPCQPFSKSGYWSKGDSLRLSDPRAATLQEYMRCVFELLPRVFLLENVHGISYSGKEEGFLLIERLTEEINRRAGVSYSLSWKVLNAADYGVPQLRTRFFLVGHREGKKFEFPAPTHSAHSTPTGEQSSLFTSQLPPYVTAWDAIGELRPAPGEELRVCGKWADLLPSIPEGENYLWHTSRKGGLPLFGWRTRYWSFLLKLAKNLPSWTIQAQPGPAIGPFHWENRRLSVEEMAALQTIPPGTKLAGSRVSVQRQLGNAVPSLLAEVIAREIARQFFRKRLSGPPRLAVKLKRPIPPPEPVQPVPTKYLHLIGEHAEHPGTGKGSRAKPAERSETPKAELLSASLAVKWLRERRAVYPAVNLPLAPRPLPDRVPMAAWARSASVGRGSKGRRPK